MACKRHKTVHTALFSLPPKQNCSCYWLSYNQLEVSKPQTRIWENCSVCISSGSYVLLSCSLSILSLKTKKEMKPTLQFSPDSPLTKYARKSQNNSRNPCTRKHNCSQFSCCGWALGRCPKTSRGPKSLQGRGRVVPGVSRRAFPTEIASGFEQMFTSMPPSECPVE